MSHKVLTSSTGASCDWDLALSLVGELLFPSSLASLKLDRRPSEPLACPLPWGNLTPLFGLPMIDRRSRNGGARKLAAGITELAECECRYQGTKTRLLTAGRQMMDRVSVTMSKKVAAVVTAGSERSFDEAANEKTSSGRRQQKAPCSSNASCGAVKSTARVVSDKNSAKRMRFKGAETELSTTWGRCKESFGQFRRTCFDGTAIDSSPSDDAEFQSTAQLCGWASQRGMRLGLNQAFFFFFFFTLPLPPIPFVPPNVLVDSARLLLPSPRRVEL